MTFWQHVLWSDETKIDRLDLTTSCLAKTWWTLSHLQSKHDGGSIMVWSCMSAVGTGEMMIIDGILVMDSTLYCNVLKQMMVPSLRKIQPWAVFQHENHPKHRSKKTPFLKKKKLEALEWPSESPGLNPIEHLGGVLKDRIGERYVSNIRQLQDLVTKEWKNIPAETCATQRREELRPDW